jgi:hypothetical protein
MPIPLGVLAVAGAGGAVAGAAYELIETISVGTAVASVSFSNLTSSYGTIYQHLQIRGTGRDSTANPYGAFALRFNSDSGSNYARHGLVGDGSSVSSGAGTSKTSIEGIMQPAGDTAAANVFGAFVIDILDPFETSKNTTARGLTGRAGVSGANEIRLQSGVWLNTASITDITIVGQLGNIMIGSRFSLYGMRSS